MSPFSETPSGWRFAIALAALAIIVAAVVVSSRRGMAMAETPDGPSGPTGSATELGQHRTGDDLTTQPRTEHTA